ncbi:hypothetical protein ACFW6K_22470 [Streptomyces sp. NPDC058733]|uniref:ATP dependent DNA ligase n=1 Tax=unclassified Streptomyces TaxID=2593676 RepID=UPI003456B1EF
MTACLRPARCPVGSCSSRSSTATARCSSLALYASSPAGALILGRYDDTGQLRLVGRSSTPLRKDAARQLAEHLTPAAPGHPSEGVRFTSSWGSTRRLDVTLVEPGLIAEIAVDTAQERGAWRHPVRYAWTRRSRTCPHLARAPEGPPGESRLCAGALSVRREGCPATPGVTHFRVIAFRPVGWRVLADCRLGPCTPTPAGETWRQPGAFTILVVTTGESHRNLLKL